jgi:uncharacterized YigZ family protein
VKLLIEKLKQQHPSAGHFCYAWQLGNDTIRFRTNDDGEPNNSAGLPVYGQIQSFNLTNILVVVVRYFGGTKLGVGGLIQAYKYATRITLESAPVVNRTIDLIFQLTFGYDELSKVMRIIKEKKLKIIHQAMGDDCVYHIGIRKSEVPAVLSSFEQLYKVEVKSTDELMG